MLQQDYKDPYSYPEGVAYMDGQYIPISKARVSILDYGFLHSDATYDVVHVWNGAFFRIDSYIDRFQNSVEKLHMKLPFDKIQLKQILHNVAGLSGLQNAYVEMICTRGTSPTFSRDPRDAENRFMAFAIPLGFIANEKQLKDGLHLAITDMVRIPPSSVDPTVKNYHWLDMIAGLYEAYDKGAENAILRNASGNIAEGPGFNIFAVIDGKLITPASGVLLGITRQTMLDLAKELEIAHECREVSAEEVMQADEIFITSSAGGPMFVSQIDNQPVGRGNLAIFSQLKKLYWEKHDLPEWKEPITYFK
ncbi:MAG: aminotransferase class IV [Alphaproteobacteria bacterium]|nr:aminotransferase class IV [Alphaproteobacteria bacterium]